MLNGRRGKTRSNPLPKLRSWVPIDLVMSAAGKENNYQAGDGNTDGKDICAVQKKEVSNTSMPAGADIRTNTEDSAEHPGSPPRQLSEQPLAHDQTGEPAAPVLEAALGARREWKFRCVAKCSLRFVVPVVISPSSPSRAGLPTR